MADSQAKMITAQAKVAEVQHKINGGEDKQGDSPQEIQLKMLSEQNKANETEMKMKDSQMDSVNRLRDRESRERLAAIRLAEEVMKNPMTGMSVVNQLIRPDMLQTLEEKEPPTPMPQ
jgi:hypothetical protein